MLRGTEPHHATRCGGRPGVHEPVTARDEEGVSITLDEVTPVPITAGDVVTVPVTAGAKASLPITAGDVVRRAPAERPRRTLPGAEREGKARARCAGTLIAGVRTPAGGAGVECRRHGRAEIKCRAVHEVKR